MLWIVHIFAFLFYAVGIVNGDDESHLNNTNSNNGSIIQQDAHSRNFQYQGVTIGGWLVLEPYITPSLFLEFNSTNGTTEADIPNDEYHFCEKLGYEEAERRLRHHWDTFYNASDFEVIKLYGLNMVRIPVGYWSFHKLDNDPYVYGAQEYLDKAIGWAYDNDLKVWVDLHGVPGSQNGFDNSGLRNLGYPGWFNETEYMDTTYRVLNTIYDKYGGYNMSQQYPNTVIGIEVVNEPLTPQLDIEDIEEFYNNTYQDSRRIQRVNNTIVFSDAFQSIGYWSNFRNYTENTENLTSSNYNLMIDHHHYEVFTSGALEMSIDDHLNSIKSYSSAVGDELDIHPAIVGEWLAALTDCTPWLNGVGIGTRYEGTDPYDNDKIGDCHNINDFDTWSDDKRKGYRKFVEMQLDQYSTKMNGWIFWCFKTEATIEWDFKRLVELELMPSPLDDRKYIINGTDIEKNDSDDDNDDDSDKEDLGSINYPSNLLLLTLLLWFVLL